MVLGVISKCIDIITHHKRQLLIWTCLPFSGPWVCGKKSIQLSPSVIIFVAFMEHLIAFPLIDCIGAGFKMPFAIGVVRHEIMHLKLLARGRSFNSSLKWIRSACGWSISIHLTSLFGQKRTGTLFISHHLQFDSRKKGMTSLAKVNVSFDKILGMNTKMIFKQDQIKGEEQQVNIMTTDQITTDLWMTVELKWEVIYCGATRR